MNTVKSQDEYCKINGGNKEIKKFNRNKEIIKRSVTTSNQTTNSTEIKNSLDLNFAMFFVRCNRK
ncbi:hypothetical protein GCM10010129_84680 [Streptomyces fumigatiscleroticus]|nr:hypothetical protein GCM10010129_84680 [Streptomyces fumigatiscleroticus]